MGRRLTTLCGCRDDGGSGTKNGCRCKVPPALVLPALAPPAPAPPAPGSPAPAPPAPVPPAPPPPAPAPPAPAPPGPAPPALVPPAPPPPAPVPPAPAPPSPGSPASLPRAPKSLAPVPPAPSPPALAPLAPRSPAPVLPASALPAPVPPAPGSPALAPPTPPALAAPVPQVRAPPRPLVRAPPGPAAPAPLVPPAPTVTLAPPGLVAPAPPGLVAPAPSALVPPAAGPPAPAAPLLRHMLPPAAALGAVPLGAAALGAAATHVHCPAVPCPALAPPCPKCCYAATAACATAAAQLLLLVATACHGHYHCPTLAAAECGGVSLAAAASRVGYSWGSPGGGAWGATYGGPCESTLAGSAAGRREEAPGAVEATSLGAFDSASAGAEPEEALHTFTLESGASRCFFRNSTTVTPLTVHVPVTLADPSGGLVVACPCPAAPSGLLTCLLLPSFTKNLVATSVLQDQRVIITQLGGELVAICTDSRTGEHLATFTRRPGSGLYTLTTESALVAKSGQVAASVEVAVSCSSRFLTHRTLLWHHRLGHPSLPRMRGMHSHLLVSGLPRSLPPLPRSLALPCLPCVEGRQRAAPHSSSFPLTTTLQTLHMDSKADVRSVLIHWIRAVRLQLHARFREDLPIQRLHSNRGGEFCSRLLADFCGAEGSVQSYTLPASPQHNGIAECRIGLVMESDTEVEQLNLWPHVSHPETSPSLRWMGEVGDALAFQVLGSLTLVRYLPTGKLSPRTLWCVFLGFPTDAPPWQFYHPGSCRVLSSCDVTFDESIFFYSLHPHRSSSVPLPPLSLVDDPPPRSLLAFRLYRLHRVDSGAAGSGNTGGADSRGAGSGGAASPTGAGGAGGAAPGGFASGGAGGAGAGGAGARAGGAGLGGASAGVPGVGRAGGTGIGGIGATGGTEGAGPVGASAVVPRVGGTSDADTRGATGGTGVGGASRQESLSPQQLRAWAVRWGSPGGGAGDVTTQLQ
ncbi:unnamed protein product [Closterium sp. NIES-54]